ncbi:hypothetical protein ACS8YF_19415, partial [Salinisphaera sp. SWV1]|uniref:hypothetical protein n=1 Tax=Salinisphaera sp. SWV1 TaxID=3454139 RepID=UPI003F871CCE
IGSAPIHSPLLTIVPRFVGFFSSALNLLLSEKEESPRPVRLPTIVYALHGQIHQPFAVFEGFA